MAPEVLSAQPGPRAPWWRRLRIDGFLTAIVVAAVIGSIVPARGWAIPAVDWLGTILIGLLFFLYGTRLSPVDTLHGLRNWRLHGLVFGFTFVLFPLVGLGLSLLLGDWLGTTLALGILYLTLCPSTVQSSVNFTSIAGGNVAGAVVSASVSNILGVFLTPLLAMLLIGGMGVHINPSSILTVAANILAPYLVGQVLRRWTLGFVTRHPRLKLVDQGSIVVIVYAAFSEAMRSQSWSQTTIGRMIALVVILSALVAVMLSLSWWTAGRVGMDRADQIAAQMCATKKSLMTGLPMAAVIFAGSGHALGLVGLPLMVFHQIQLMACGALASHHARSITPREAAGGGPSSQARSSGSSAQPDRAGGGEPHRGSRHRV